MARAFSKIHIQTRSCKPRSAGLTMMIDWGLPLALQSDTMKFACDFIDLAKIAVGISRLLAEDVLAEKLSRYQDAAAEPFPGGMLLEMAYKQGQVEHYYESCRRVGYQLVEVSDNVVELPWKDKRYLIREAIETYGFRVLGEVGSKRKQTELRTLITDVKRCLDAGAWRVFVEAAEMVSNDGFDIHRLEGLLAEVEPATIILELPGKWIGVDASEVHQMMVWLVGHIGPEVNIGNVLPMDVVALETLRTEVGVNMSPMEA